MPSDGLIDDLSRDSPVEPFLEAKAKVLAKLKMTATNVNKEGNQRLSPRLRLVILFLILGAFLRLTWRLDVKTLWWDESLSLQRAESHWDALLAGKIILTDGAQQVVTWDQHPFAYFILLGVFIRGVGTSEFAVRFPSVFAATLLVPMIWALGRLLERRGVLPRSTSVWAASLVAVNPFYLWFGREVRMYTWLSLLAAASAYFLLRLARSRGASTRIYLGAFLGTALLLAATHYYGFFLFPAFLIGLWGEHRKKLGRLAWWGIIGAFIVTAMGLFVLLRRSLIQEGSGSNFQPISWNILVPDLVNAFSLGLSVSISNVWPVDLLFAGLASAGLIQGLRKQGWFADGGLTLAACLLVPPALLLAIDQIRPAYMNARHMSHISAFFLLTVAAGLAWLYLRNRWVLSIALAVLLSASGYSTVRYFVEPRYAGDDFRSLATYLKQELQPDDLLLLRPAALWRLFDYYLLDNLTPNDENSSGVVHWRGVPLLDGELATEAFLSSALQNYERIWLVSSDALWYIDPDHRIEQWLTQHGVLIGRKGFQSGRSRLDLFLFLSQSPVVQEADIAMRSAIATFGDSISLIGYDLGPNLRPGMALPVNLYWRAERPLQRRYKYILRLIDVSSNGDRTVVGLTEREPYDGAFPTSSWALGTVLIERSGVPGAGFTGDLHAYELTLQVYDAETLEKLPVTELYSGAERADEFTVRLHLHEKAE